MFRSLIPCHDRPLHRNRSGKSHASASGPREQLGEASARVRVAREQVQQLRSLTRQANTLRDELLALIKAHRPQLLAETGCGPLTAAILIGRTAGAERFASDASFAL